MVMSWRATSPIGLTHHSCTQAPWRSRAAATDIPWVEGWATESSGADFRLGPAVDRFLLFQGVPLLLQSDRPNQASPFRWRNRHKFTVLIPCSGCDHTRPWFPTSSRRWSSDAAVRPKTWPSRIRALWHALVAKLAHHVGVNSQQLQMLCGEVRDTLYKPLLQMHVRDEKLLVAGSTEGRADTVRISSTSCHHQPCGCDSGVSTASTDAHVVCLNLACSGACRCAGISIAMIQRTC